MYGGCCYCGGGWHVSVVESLRLVIVAGWPGGVALIVSLLRCVICAAWSAFCRHELSELLYRAAGSYLDPRREPQVLLSMQDPFLALDSTTASPKYVMSWSPPQQSIVQRSMYKLEAHL